MYHRYLGDRIRVALNDTPVVMLNGARQTGKSTLCQQLITSGTFTGELLTLDDPTTLEAAQLNALAFLQGYGKALIIDEIQRAPELLLSMKKLVDSDRQGRRFILTGSADVMMLPKVADSLAGRMEIMHLWPLSQSEILNRRPHFVDHLVAEGAGFGSASVSWEELIQAFLTGGYPESLVRNQAARRTKWLESYLASLLQKDIRDLSNIEGLSQIPNILQLVAARIGSTINFSDISRLSGVKNTTLQRYIALLEHIFLLVKIPAWTPNAEGKFVKSPKVYLNDTGLLCHLRGEDHHSLQAGRTAAGKVFENFVVLEILKQLSWSDRSLVPFHFSIHKSHEVDLVLVSRKSQFYGIEIKDASSLNTSDFNGLRRLEELTKSKFKKGIVLYTGDKMVPFGKNMFAVPVSGIWK